jgi:uncharacterized damage-inducible protein DinB
MTQHLSDYARYNHWANKGLADLFRQQSDAWLETPIVSSFPSVRDTFLHLWSVEDVWHQRLQGHSPAQFIAKAFTGSNAEIFDGLLGLSQALVEFVDAQPAAYFETPIAFTLLTAPGTQAQLPGDMLLHLFNHQTMHRGQLITLGRQLGLSAFPRTDYIIWLREQGR